MAAGSGVQRRLTLRHVCIQYIAGTSRPDSRAFGAVRDQSWVIRRLGADDYNFFHSERRRQRNASPILRARAREEWGTHASCFRTGLDACLLRGEFADEGQLEELSFAGLDERDQPGDEEGDPCDHFHEHEH